MNKEIHRFKIGSFECMAVSDGTHTYAPHVFPPSASFLFTNAPRQRLERLYDAIETGNINLMICLLEFMNSETSRRNCRPEGLKLITSYRIGESELASPKMVSHYINELRNLLNNSSLSERKAFIRSFVKEVKLTGDDVLLTYTMLLTPRGTSE